jgi:hypothetical protein
LHVDVGVWAAHEAIIAGREHAVSLVVPEETQRQLALKHRHFSTTVPERTERAQEPSVGDVS